MLVILSFLLFESCVFDRIILDSDAVNSKSKASLKTRRAERLAQIKKFKEICVQGAYPWKASQESIIPLMSVKMAILVTMLVRSVRSVPSVNVLTTWNKKFTLKLVRDVHSLPSTWIVVVSC